MAGLDVVAKSTNSHTDTDFNYIANNYPQVERLIFDGSSATSGSGSSDLVYPLKNLKFLFVRSGFIHSLRSIQFPALQILICAQPPHFALSEDLPSLKKIYYVIDHELIQVNPKAVSELLAIEHGLGALAWKMVRLLPSSILEDLWGYTTRAKEFLA